MDDSWMMPKWAVTIVGRAHLATWEQLLDEFAKNWADPLLHMSHDYSRHNT